MKKSLEQLINFMSGKRKISELWSFDKDKKTIKPSFDNLHPLTKLTILGIHTISPTITETSGILHNPQRLQLVSDFILFSIYLNDYLDLCHSQQTPSRYCEGIKNKLDEMNEKLRTALNLNELKRFKPIILQAEQEIKIIEEYIKKQEGLSLDKVDEYRNLVNIINNLAITCIILDDDKLMQKIMSTNQETRITYDAVKNKYDWALDNKWETEIEKIVLIMHNMAMAAQIDDDWWGRHIDDMYGLTHTFAHAALAQTNQNTTKAKTLLNQKKQAYLSQAKHLGLGYLPTRGMNTILNLAQRFTRVATIRYRSGSKLQKRIFQSFIEKMGVREKAYAFKENNS